LAEAVGLRGGPQSAIINWLRSGAGEADPCDKVIETSISWVFLFRDRVLKLKKAIDLGFLDFSSTDRRHWACARELAFNRLTAPDIYRAVHRIAYAPDGGFAFDGPGETADWVVEMRRFDDTAVLTNRLSVVTGPFAEDLGRQVARLQAAAPICDVGGSENLRIVVDSNAERLRLAIRDLGEADVEGVIDAIDAAFAGAETALDERFREGFVRACHGDLHLGNILLEDGRAVLFDCIEFSVVLREIDVLYDTAFLLMDLGFRSAPEAANRAFNGWVDEAARSFGPNHLRGLSLLGLFQAVRACVRAHVSAAEGHIDLAKRYLAAARSHLAPSSPRLVAIGGLSGSGKSTLARALAPTLGASPGALVLRSDEIRKRLWDRAPTEALPAEAYSPIANAAVYQAMFDMARASLMAGWPVVLDAAFLRETDRLQAEAQAVQLGVPFHGVWLEAPVDALRDRLASRTGDASDADPAVLGSQLTQDLGHIAWIRHASTSLPETTAEVARAALPQELSNAP